MKIQDTIIQYLTGATIHGLVYIAEGRNVIEKFVWLLIVASSFSVASFMIYTSISETNQEPLLTVLETAPIQDVPFPAITISGDDRVNQWGFVQKVLNMATFYGPDKKEIVKDSKELRSNTSMIMEKIIWRMLHELGDQRVNWSLSDFKDYPNQSGGLPSLVKGQVKTIRSLVPKMSGIYQKSPNVANDMVEDFVRALGIAFFENVYYRMTSFLKNEVGDIVDAYIESEDYSTEIAACQNEAESCISALKRYYNLLYLPFEVNKFPYENLGFGAYLAYFSRLLTRTDTVELFNTWTTSASEQIIRESMAELLISIAGGQNMANMSTLELVRLLHKDPDRTNSISFANPLQVDFNCTGDAIEAYFSAWEYTKKYGTGVPCEKGTVFLHQGTQKDYSACCQMSNTIQGKIEAILKVMKYSTQPVLFSEPLEDFLEVFGNIDAIGNNLTKFPTMKLYLMETNYNPRVFMCQYDGQPKHLDPKLCNLFYSSMTNEGFGYSFNMVNFWDIFKETSFTQLYSKIMRPKGYNTLPAPIESRRWVYPGTNLFFPDFSGPAYGLTVRM